MSGHRLRSLPGATLPQAGTRRRTGVATNEHTRLSCFPNRPGPDAYPARRRQHLGSLFTLASHGCRPAVTSSREYRFRRCIQPLGKSPWHWSADRCASSPAAPKKGRAATRRSPAPRLPNRRESAARSRNGSLCTPGRPGQRRRANRGVRPERPRPRPHPTNIGERRSEPTVEDQSLS
jgi:hypothetical protein